MAFCLMLSGHAFAVCSNDTENTTDDFQQARVGKDAVAAVFFADVSMIGRVVRLQILGISDGRRLVIAGRG